LYVPTIEDGISGEQVFPCLWILFFHEKSFLVERTISRVAYLEREPVQVLHDIVDFV
jgi:hypothetical protein